MAKFFDPFMLCRFSTKILTHLVEKILILNHDFEMFLFSIWLKKINDIELLIEENR